MGLFQRKKSAPPAYPTEDYEPVIRCSICTGEQVACMKNRHTGKLQEIMLLRTPEDLSSFCRRYGLQAGEIKKIY